MVCFAAVLKKAVRQPGAAILGLFNMRKMKLETGVSSGVANRTNVGQSMGLVLGHCNPTTQPDTDLLMDEKQMWFL